MFKLASIVVAYNPDVKDVVKNTYSYAELCDLVIVWDNTPNGDNDWTELSDLGDKVRVYSYGENIGLASAYNRGIDIALENGCSFLMTMDQDSCFENFKVLKEFVEEYEGTEYGIFCPPVNTPVSNCGEIIPVSYTVQSGCIFSLEMIKAIGRFRDDFFIGMVDAEMQLKAADNGYKIAQIGGCNLIHQIGSGRVVKKYGRKFHVMDYGPLRYYYDSRNRILMWKEFPNDFSTSKKVRFVWKRFGLCGRILLAEDQKMKKISAILRGTFWGILGVAKPY